VTAAFTRSTPSFAAGRPPENGGRSLGFAGHHRLGASRGGPGHPSPPLQSPTAGCWVKRLCQKSPGGTEGRSHVSWASEMGPLLTSFWTMAPCAFARASSSPPAPKTPTPTLTIGGTLFSGLRGGLPFGHSSKYFCRFPLGRVLCFQKSVPLDLYWGLFSFRKCHCPSLCEIDSCFDADCCVYLPSPPFLLLGGLGSPTAAVPAMTSWRLAAMSTASPDPSPTRPADSGPPPHRGPRRFRNGSSIGMQMVLVKLHNTPWETMPSPFEFFLVFRDFFAGRGGAGQEETALGGRDEGVKLPEEVGCIPDPSQGGGA